MRSKKVKRLKRALRARKKIEELGVDRLTVHRSGQHIYGQVIGRDGRVKMSASSLEGSIKEAVQSLKGKIAVAVYVGKVLAERALSEGVKVVAFDRSGFKYHGRVKAFAEGAREGGLDF